MQVVFLNKLEYFWLQELNQMDLIRKTLVFKKIYFEMPTNTSI